MRSVSDWLSLHARRPELQFLGCKQSTVRHLHPGAGTLQERRGQRRFRTRCPAAWTSELQAEWEPLYRQNKTESNWERQPWKSTSRLHRFVASMQTCTRTYTYTPQPKLQLPPPSSPLLLPLHTHEHRHTKPHKKYIYTQWDNTRSNKEGNHLIVATWVSLQDFTLSE